MQGLKQTWRWYGPSDTVSLSDIKQAGAQGIVSALHHIPHGEIWSVDEIRKRKKLIESAGFSWEVVESVNVHEAIKTRSDDCQEYLENYRRTLINLAENGMRKICYNFMPILDWTRTQLDYELPDGAKALRFDWCDLAVFDCFILKRKEADLEYKAYILQEAEKRFKNYTSIQLETLTNNVLMGVPGEASSTLDQLRQGIEKYRAIGRDGLRENLVFFLKNIREVCEEYQIKMILHPDDPPMPILGLPRIVGSLVDFQWIFKQVPQTFNGLCYCSGSLGASKANDLLEILEYTKKRVYFAHLRNVTKDLDGNFYEADHLGGDNDMAAIVQKLLNVQRETGVTIPYRPDHGHQMLDDLQKVSHPGYSAIGRLRGLAELRGLERGLAYKTKYPSTP